MFTCQLKDFILMSIDTNIKLKRQNFCMKFKCAFSQHLKSNISVDHEKNPRKVRHKSLLRPQLREEGVDGLRGFVQVGPGHRGLRQGDQNCLAQEG